MIRVIIIGGGFGGFYTAKNLEKYKELKPILIDPSKFFEYTPLIHEVCGGEIPANSTMIFYRKSLKRTKFIKAKVKRIIFKEKKVILDNKNYISYDYLVISSGAIPKKRIEGSENLPTLHNLNDALKIRKILVELSKKEKCSISVIGEGATGTELVGELGEFKKHFNQKLEIHHFLYFEKYFMNYRGFDYYIKKRMIQLGIKVHPAEPVLQISDNTIITIKGNYKSDYIIMCTGIKPAVIESNKDFKKGYPVNNFCEIEKDNNVYAIGDVALFPLMDHFAPNLAQVAVKQAKFIVRDIIRKEKNKKRKPLKLKINFFIISLGKYFGLARVFDKISISGLLFWFLKRTYYFFNIIRLGKKISIIKFYIISLFLSKKYLREKIDS